VRLRKYKFECYLDERENHQLTENAERAGLSKSEYFRKVLAGQKIKELPPMEFYDVLKELRQINNNMNQIAARANSIGFIDISKYKENAAQLQKVIGDLMKEVFG